MSYNLNTADSENVSLRNRIEYLSAVAKCRLLTKICQLKKQLSLAGFLARYRSVKHKSTSVRRDYKVLCAFFEPAPAQFSFQPAAKYLNYTTLVPLSLLPLAHFIESPYMYFFVIIILIVKEVVFKMMESIMKA